MRTFLAVFVAVVGLIHFSHVSQTLGLPQGGDEDLADFDAGNGTNTTTTEAPDANTTTTQAPDTNTTTTEAPDANTTTTQAPDTNGTTTQGPDTNGTTTQGPDTNGTTTENPDTNSTTTIQPGTTSNAPKPTKGSNTGGKGKSFDGVSFVGGIILGVGVVAIVVVVYKVYNRKSTAGYNAM